MAGINRVILIGNLGKDPDVITFENGVKKATFSLATTESYKNKDGNRVDQTEWHNIVLWRGLADIAERYLHKGNQIYLEGKLRTRTYEQDGVKKYITEIFGDNMTMLGGRKEPTEENQPVSRQDAPVQQSNDNDMQMPDDDLPF